MVDIFIAPFEMNFYEYEPEELATGGGLWVVRPGEVVYPTWQLWRQAPWLGKGVVSWEDFRVAIDSLWPSLQQAEWAIAFVVHMSWAIQWDVEIATMVYDGIFGWFGQMTEVQRPFDAPDWPAVVETMRKSIQGEIAKGYNTMEWDYLYGTQWDYFAVGTSWCSRDTVMASG